MQQFFLGGELRLHALYPVALGGEGTLVIFREIEYVFIHLIAVVAFALYIEFFLHTRSLFFYHYNILHGAKCGIFAEILRIYGENCKKKERARGAPVLFFLSLSC